MNKENTAKNGEIFYMDDNHNFVDKDKATIAVIQEFDETGNLINESWSYLKKKEEEKLPDNQEVKVKYVDDNGNEVEKEEATNMIFNTYVDGKLVSTDSFKLIKENKQL